MKRHTHTYKTPGKFRRSRISTELLTNQVRYLSDVNKELFDAHVHPEHFSTALQKVADYLGAETAFFLLPGIQPHGKRKLYTNLSHRALDKSFVPLVPFQPLYSTLKGNGGFLSHNILPLSQKYPAIRKLISRYRIYSLMLIPVTGPYGELTFILGACNFKRHWMNTEPLDQVSLSFCMAINYFRAYQSLKQIGQTDSLTGLKNRNSYLASLTRYDTEKHSSLSCIYIDANGLHEVNNHLGHHAGDELLKTVAEVLKHVFYSCDVYRIGGDEFVILCSDQPEEDLYHFIQQVRSELSESDCTLSIGMEWSSESADIGEIITAAESAMQLDKQKFYEGEGGDRQMRILDQKLEQLLVQKQDADTFLSILSPEFTGVYFVDLSRDTIRHLYIPSYFETILRECDDIFSQALILYARRLVKPEYYTCFELFCDYGYLENQLDSNTTPEFTYQKNDGSWLKVRILKFKSYMAECRETLWIFSDIDSTISLSPEPAV